MKTFIGEYSMQVNLHEAKRRFSELVEAASRAESIVIVNTGRPVAILGPEDFASRPVRLGLMKNRIRINKGFSDPLPESILRAFESTATSGPAHG